MSSKAQTDLGHKLLQACKKRDADSTEVFVLLRTGADVSMTGADGKSARISPIQRSLNYRKRKKATSWRHAVC